MIRLICIQTDHAHWASHSGYHHFLDHFPNDIHVTHLRVPQRRIQWKDLQGLEKIWFRPTAILAKFQANLWTSNHDLLAEFRLIKQVRDAQKMDGKVIVHFLDGECGYNFFGFLFRLFFLRGKERVRMVATYHQPTPLLEKILPHRKRIKKLDLVLIVGMSQTSFFDFLPQEQLRFVPHGIDTCYYSPAKHQKNNGLVFCLTVGHWLRDFDILEQVIRSAPEKVIFRIVALKEHIARFEGLSNVELYSGIDDDELLRLYRHSDIGLMPLQDSTANNGLLEMMSCGLPIIVSRVGSVTDYLPEDAGIIVGNNNLQTLIAAVQKLAGSPAERNRLGKAARSRALELDWSNTAHKMADFYRQIQ